MSRANRRLGSGPRRNMLRRNSDAAKKKSTSKSDTSKKKKPVVNRELASQYKSRSSKFKRSAIDRIKTTINKRYEAIGPLRDRLKEFEIRESDSQLVADDITNVLTIQSDKLTAHRYLENGNVKIIIEGLTGVDDNGFGMIDSIRAIVEDFGQKDLNRVEIFIDTKNSNEQQALMNYLSIDKDLMKKINFIERKEKATEVEDDIDDDEIIKRSMEPAISSVMDSEFLKFKMKEVPKEMIINYLDVIDKLNTYHSSLENYRQALYSENDPSYIRSPESGDQTSKKILETLEGVQNSKQELENLETPVIENLKESIRTYIRNSDSLPNKSGVKKEQNNVMGPLLKQLESQTRMIFNEAIPGVEKINTDIDDIRREVIFNLFNPLQKSDIDKNRKTENIGEGAGGAVQAVTFKGPPLFYAAVKLDGASNDEGGKSGIPSTNPEQSKRAVSAYLLSKYFNLNIIPETRFYVNVDQETRLTQIGHAMEFIDGQIGQVNGLYDNGEATALELKKIQDAEEILGQGWPGPDNEKKRVFNAANNYMLSFTKIDGKYYKDRPSDATIEGIENAVEFISNGMPIKPKFINEQQILNYYEQVRQYNDYRTQAKAYKKEDNGEYRKIVGKPPSNISLQDGAVQKSLSDLQLFDVIIGHADRHGENLIFERNSEGKVTGIKGIDNSDSFGKEWKPKSDPLHPSKTPGVPPVIDLKTAIKILRLKKDDDKERVFGDLLGKNLSKGEIEAAIDRLTTVQKTIVDGIMSGEVQMARKGSASNIEDIAALSELLSQYGHKINETILANTVVKWGEDRVFRQHSEDNSYLGISQALGDSRGFQEPLTAL